MEISSTISSVGEAVKSRSVINTAVSGICALVAFITFSVDGTPVKTPRQLTPEVNMISTDISEKKDVQ